MSDACAWRSASATEVPEVTELAMPLVPNVLLVDDNEANLVALEAVLEPLECNLVRATSEHEALRQLLFRDFAVLLLDLMMPDLDGLATAGLVKNRPATQHIPIIFLTGIDTQAKTMARAYAHGAVDYLIKPFDPDVLRSKVAVFIDLFQKAQELRVQTELARRSAHEAIANRRLYEEERGARAQAEEIARTREDAVAVVAHDLRNPMSAISANASLIASALEKGQTDGLLNRVETIQNGVARMNALIQDLLDSVRIQSGSLTVSLRVEHIASIVVQIVELLGPTLATKKQAFEVVLPERQLQATCDRERVFQVLSNLLGNASKFSPEGTTITVKATRESREVLVEVIDRGAGISHENLPHIFEPYWRASQQRQQGLGLGRLGLAIAKGIIDAHRGRLWAESRIGAGSRFLFTLPLCEDSSVQTSDSKKPRIRV
jgi:signal transduction histidine kinase